MHPADRSWIAKAPSAPALVTRSPAEDIDGGFEALFEAHYRQIGLYALCMLANPSEAEEAASETIDRAYRAWVAGHGPNGSPLPWLLAICRNIVRAQRRRARLVRWLPLPGPDREPVDPGGDIADAEFQLWLGQLQGLLSRREFEALTLRYIEDLGDAGAALALGVSVSGFRTLISRALAKLRVHPEVWK